MRDLSGRRSRALTRMDSTCTIERGSYDDDALDTATGRLVKNVPDTALVYGPAKPCMVLPPDRVADRDRGWGGGRTDERPALVIHLPHDAGPVERDDWVWIETSPDVDIVRPRRFKVRDVDHTEFLVTRMVTLISA